MTDTATFQMTEETFTKLLALFENAHKKVTELATRAQVALDMNVSVKSTAGELMAFRRINRALKNEVSMLVGILTDETAEFMAAADRSEWLSPDANEYNRVRLAIYDAIGTLRNIQQAERLEKDVYSIASVYAIRYGDHGVQCELSCAAMNLAGTFKGRGTDFTNHVILTYQALRSR